MRYIATFTPQAWINGYAYPCDPAGETTWDVTDHLHTLEEDERRETMLADTDASDRLRDLDHAPEWVHDWTGPFYISTSAIPESDADKVLLAMEDIVDTFAWKPQPQEGDLHVFLSQDGKERLTGRIDDCGRVRFGIDANSSPA